MIGPEGVCKESSTFRLCEALPRRCSLSDAKVQDPRDQELTELEKACTDGQLCPQEAAYPPTLGTDNQDAIRDEEHGSVRERRGNDIEGIVCSIGKGCASENSKNAREQSGTRTECNDLAEFSSSRCSGPISPTDIDDHPFPVAAPGSMVQLGQCDKGLPTIRDLDNNSRDEHVDQSNDDGWDE